MNATGRMLLTVALSAGVSAAQAEVVIDTVTIGNPGNCGELSGTDAGGSGPDRVCGAVDYLYSIGKHEITAGQYTEFLNAVGADDAYGLYSAVMADGTWPTQGCNIQRSGSPGSYTYSVDPNWADRPVNYVCWGDAARFANWMHNGQPTGSQGLSTTEDGSYFLNGAVSDAALLGVVRKPEATWVIPSEDEWYKAAYHANDGVTGNYFDYPTGSDSTPSNELVDPDPGNNANFYQDDYTIGAPYWRTEVGDFENSESTYGTFDQGGNVWEWNEAVLSADRGRRGGCYDGYGFRLHASDRERAALPTAQTYCGGFRLAEVPGPGDYDGDGVDDAFDVCNNTTVGVPVDGEGRPLGDIDKDCDTDLTDFALFQQGFTGPLSP